MHAFLATLWAGLRWAVLPLTAGVLATTAFHAMNFSEDDPYHWDAVKSWIVLGPLVGFGFLAGATSCLPEAEGRTGLRRICARRAVWVGLGPWSGFLFWMGAGLVSETFFKATGRHPLENWGRSELVVLFVLWTMAYGWVVIAALAVLRARRAGCVARSLKRGMAIAVGFVGSLLGAFWAAISLWRTYFFDPAALRTILIALACLTLLGGCGPSSVGEVRRRELFDALLLAWVVGLALIWRWQSRSRR
jgi:hypothetical protein